MRILGGLEDDAEDDAVLLAAWRAGDEQAGNRLVRRHFRGMYRFFRRRTSASAAEDLTQQTFLACVQARERAGDQAGFRAYLFGIARKQFLMHLRQKDRRERAMERLELKTPEPSGKSPSGVVAVRQEHRLLLRALKQLPIDLQITVELHYWEQLTSSEVAAALEIPTSTVTTRLSRARTLLKKHIVELEVSEDLRQSTIQNLEVWAKALRGFVERED